MLRELRRGSRGMRDVRLADGHGFRTGEVRKVEPQLAARKARANRILQRQVFRVGRFFAVGDGCRVAPAGNPFRKFLGHGYNYRYFNIKTVEKYRFFNTNDKISLKMPRI